MPVAFQCYRPEPRFGEDYGKIRSFLIRLNDHNFHFGRWDWMITHSCLDESGLERIGLWEEGGRVVAMAAYDCRLGGAFLPVLPDYAYLKEEMFAYAVRALAKDGACGVLIADGDMALQSAARRHGYVATQDKDYDAMFPLDRELAPPTLPEGFRLTSMAETYDLFKYGQALWKGFNHEADGEGPFVMNDGFTREFERPNVNLNIKIAVVAPSGDFVSYCGMWQDAACTSALVEPVATDPAYRRLGLGRAAVLEGLRRCQQLGATRAYVGSSQQFYYSIGFFPFATATWWRKPE